MANQTNTDRVKTKLYLDIALTMAFILSLRPFLTGLAIHEWLGLAIGGALAFHTMLHWKWAVGLTRRLLGGVPLRARIYYALDATLLLAFLTIIGSGVIMSRVVLPALGLQGSIGEAWYLVHKFASYLTLVLLGVKLVLHRRWISNAIRHHLRWSGPATTAGRQRKATDLSLDKLA